jgi:Kip1 ubiquitination-promoting complex protein 1
MDYRRPLSNIFGVHIACEDETDFSRCLDLANDFLDRKLENVENDDDGAINGLICNSKHVVWDIESSDNITNLVKVSKDRLSLLSQSAFSTNRANACVYSGKFMYEVQLKSKGVMQIGFCSAQCSFTQDTGVGDTKHSYGLDGSKKRLWHVSTKTYGPFWRSGDIFGVCLDMDNGTIEYHRNGVALGIAFENIDRGPGFALFPAVSLAFNDSITANFGSSPFRYPVDGFKPFQNPPKKLLTQADYLLEYLVNISRLISSNQNHPKPNSSCEITIDSFYLLVANSVVERIVPLLMNPYVVEEKVIRIIKNLCVLKSTSNSLIQPGESGSTLDAFLSLLWNHLEESEMKIFLKRLLCYLSSTFKETPTDLEYETQRRIIVMLNCLCNHDQTRKYFLEHKFFKKNTLPLFLYIKPPDESTLELLLPDDSIWTEGLGGDKKIYLDACEKLKSYTSILYALQKKLIVTLLKNNDGNEDSPSSRKIFMSRLRGFTLDNMSSNYSTTTQPAIGLSLLCLLLDVARDLHKSERGSEKYLKVDYKFFFDGSYFYGSSDRVGGVLSHLNKVFKKELTEALGNDFEPSTTNQENSTSFLRDIYSTMFLVANNGFQVVRPSNSNSRQNDVPVTSGNLENYKSISEIIDCAIIFYQNIAYKYVVMIADLRDNISHLSNILIETKHCRDEVLKNLEEFKNSIEGFSSSTDDVMKELSERFLERKNIFAVSFLIFLHSHFNFSVLS